jgi:hypothetical protein
MEIHCCFFLTGSEADSQMTDWVVSSDERKDLDRMKALKQFVFVVAGEEVVGFGPWSWVQTR